MKPLRVSVILASWGATLLLPHFCQAEKGKEVEELATTLILAASPFVNTTYWRPSSLARRLNMSPSDSSKQTVKDRKMTIETPNGDDSGLESSRIHEVRVVAPFSVKRTVDREGKSLYSPGPLADRREQMEHLENPFQFQQAHPRFLESAVKQISSLLSHGLTGATKGELKDPHQLENSSEFTPVKGSPKAFPPFIETQVEGKNELDSFSQPEDSVASSSAWTPHLIPPHNSKGGDKETEKEKSSKFTEDQLERFKDLLRRQKRIKQGFLRSLQLSKGRGAPIDTQLEEGKIPKKAATSDKEKPFIDIYFDIDGDKLREQQRERRREEQKPVKFLGPVPVEMEVAREGEDKHEDKTDKEGDAESVEAEEMNKSGNNHMPVFVTSAGMHNPHLKHEVVDMLDSGVWSPHGEKVPTLHYSAAQLMAALSQGNLPHVRKNKDGRLEIPIKLDAHISIPEFQQAFGNLFQNYSAGITLHDAHGQPHDGKTNHPEIGYVPPGKKGKDVTGFALLGNLPQSIHHPPSFIYEPPTSDYSHPELEKESPYSPPPTLSLYSLPNDKYEAPNSGYSLPKPSYQPPTTLYEPPHEEESSYEPPHKEYKAPKSSYGSTGSPASLYETPKEDYKPPTASYGPPEKLKSLYDTPFKEYKAPKSSYEEPKEYSPPSKTYKEPKEDYGAPAKPKLNSGYKPPSSLYTPPKESPSYETPVKEYKPAKELKLKTSYAPPTSLYTPPKKSPSYEKPKEKPKYEDLSSSYNPPSDSYSPPGAKVPKSFYQTPKTPQKSLKAPNKLYDAPEKLKPTEPGSTYAPPPGYKPERKPTYPDAVYSAAPGISAEVYQITVAEAPHVAVKTLPLPSGYDYRAPFGFSAENNPTFPKQELYQPPKPVGYKAPEGYDYSTPEGYKASENPTFPKELYQEPGEDYRPPLVEKDKNGYSYDAPHGYSPHENPTFPKEHYKAPKKPDDGYQTPTGYDYQGPQGYDPSKNPTFPKSHYETSKKEKIPHSSPAKGYKAPTGYDYGAPKGYNPGDNPTFPKTSKKEHLRGKTKKYQAGLDTGYTPPGQLGGGQHQEENKKGQKLPIEYDYTPPHGYDASENPTFPKKPEEGYHYSAPPSQNPSYNPTFPHRPPPPASLYTLPGESHAGGSGYPKHSFNIIIKNKDKPPTELRINADGHQSRHTPLETQLRLGSNSVLQKKRGQLAHEETSNNIQAILEDLMKGTEQLLFSFIVPSTFCSTDNIVELQKSVTQGCNKLQRKLLFADSLAKLPYKIGAIRGILTNLVNNLKELQFKTKTSGLSSTDVAPAFSMFNDLQKSTAGLCRGQSSLPVLAVELQKSCDLLQDAKVVTIFNMIAVPCFVYQGAVGLLGDRLHQLGKKG